MAAFGGHFSESCSRLCGSATSVTPTGFVFAARTRGCPNEPEILSLRKPSSPFFF